jgi:hypothetical protein
MDSRAPRRQALAIRHLESLSITEHGFAKMARVAHRSILVNFLNPFQFNALRLETCRAALASKLPHTCLLQCLWRLLLAYFERIRDVLSEPFSPDVIRQRTAGGWQMVSIEWRRELPDSETPPEGAFSEAIPYGLRISEDCKRLEVDPHENQVLLIMMDLLAQDFSYSAIVSDLNEKGFRTREDRPWSRVTVFNMMPRLIEVGPRIFSSEEWEQRRIKLARRGAP